MVLKSKAKDGTVAIGTWPTPEKPDRWKKTRKKKKKIVKKTGEKAIDTVPLPEKPVSKKRTRKAKRKRLNRR